MRSCLLQITTRPFLSTPIHLWCHVTYGPMSAWKSLMLTDTQAIYPHALDKYSDSRRWSALKGCETLLDWFLRVSSAGAWVISRHVFCIHWTYCSEGKRVLILFMSQSWPCFVKYDMKTERWYLLSMKRDGCAMCHCGRWKVLAYRLILKRCIVCL